jgi:hypothetical protein
MTVVWLGNTTYSLLYWEYSELDGLFQGCVEVGFISAAHALRRALSLGLKEFRIECAVKRY